MERFVVVAGCLLLLAAGAGGAPITFGDLVTGFHAYGFDGDGDGSDDVIFTMMDGSGFVSMGFGSSQIYIDEPGLGGTSLLGPDLRVDFPTGAREMLRFGFALDSSMQNDTASLLVYDASHTLLASTTVTGLYTYTPNRSSDPEGFISLPFTGTASYATLDFTPDSNNFAIDNFEGIYGTSEGKGIPVPGALLLGSLGAALIGWRQWRRTS